MPLLTESEELPSMPPLATVLLSMSAPAVDFR